MKQFYLHHDRVEITLANGSKLDIYFTPDTGKVFYSYKNSSGTLYHQNNSQTELLCSYFNDTVSFRITY